MNKEQILKTIKELSYSQGFYERLYERLTDDSEESKNFLSELEKQDFKDPIDLVIYLEE